MSVDPRELRHRVTIERRVNRQDAATGEITTAWAVEAQNVAAKIVPLSVREFVAGQSLQSGITTRITLRHRAGLTADMRLVHNGKIYNPQGWLADPDSGLDYVTAPCTEGFSKG